MNPTSNPSSMSNPRGMSLRSFLGNLKELDQLDIDSELELIELAAGETLFEQGDPGDSMYILVAGALGVRVTQADGTINEIDRLAPGAKVGELALLSGQVRSATVYAVNDAGLIRVTQQGFEQLSDTQKADLVEMETTVAERWQRLQLNRVLKKLFHNYDVMDLHQLQEQLEWQHLSNGEVLFRANDEADSMYLVVNGRLRFHAPTADTEDDVYGEIGPGETVGEFALLTDERRTATVFATRETNVVKLDRQKFEMLGREYPSLVREIARIIVVRRQKALQQNKPNSVDTLNITLVPGSTTVDVDQFAKELASSLNTYGSAVALTSQTFDELYGQSGISSTSADSSINPAIVSWLGDLEAKENYLVFATDYEMTNWTERCVGQADRVVVVVDAADDPALSPVEKALKQSEYPIRTELAIWHPAGTNQPSGTIRWLEPRSVQNHYHVRKNDQSHMARMARRVTGRAVSIVLSGGAARGFAHLGLHKAMKELDLPFDFISGTSMGAVIAGGFYIGETPEELLKIAHVISDPKALVDRTIPYGALMSSKKVSDVIQGLFGDRQIEDLWIPFFCVASNLTTAEMRIFESGPMWRAIRASLAIPGMYLPILEDGDILVDGGVMNNFPVKLMADRSESEFIIGVDVNPLHDKKRYYDYDTHMSGFKVFLSRINPFAKRIRVPNIVGVLLRTLDINSLHRSKEEVALADLIIQPDVSKFSIQDYTKYKQLVEAGYNASIDLLKRWKTERYDAEKKE